VKSSLIWLGDDRGDCSAGIRQNVNPVAIVRVSTNADGMAVVIGQD
jgi:hypothetical protein